MDPARCIYNDNGEKTQEDVKNYVLEKLRDENRVCHVLKDGVCKCYFEFEADEGYIKNKPQDFFERI